LIRVAFWYDRPIAYSGGLNYIRNLLYAISQVNRGRLSPYLFIGTMVTAKDAEAFAQFATVIRTPILDRRSVPWFFDRLLVKLLKSHLLVKRELRKHRISIVSHAEHVAGLGPTFRVISWFPDFQFLHLPKFFPGLDVNKEMRRLRALFSKADVIILSSYSALEDFKSIAPENCIARARVLQFVSQPNTKLNVVDESETKELIERKYGFKGRYFYLPNQFWIHKNHWVVFKAVAELKSRGTGIVVICTGNLHDYRRSGTDYVDGLTEFIGNESLEHNIRILGLVPYEDVLFFMRNCLAVINPSRFEGWSSTVEEARSIGKRVVLSRIPVHLEQNPIEAEYFNPDDVSGLCAILENWWKAPEVPDPGAKNRAELSLRERTIRYGERYIELVEEVACRRLDS